MKKIKTGHIIIFVHDYINMEKAMHTRCIPCCYSQGMWAGWGKTENVGEKRREFKNVSTIKTLLWFHLFELMYSIYYKRKYM